MHVPTWTSHICRMTLVLHFVLHGTEIGNSCVNECMFHNGYLRSSQGHKGSREDEEDSSDDKHTYLMQTPNLSESKPRLFDLYTNF